MEIISRKEAINKGLKYYFTGIPCPKNHISKRSIHNWTCYECKCEARDEAHKKNPLGIRMRRAKRRAKQLNATPSWADLKAITEFYKACPDGMVVDHIVPLQAKLASGLHTIENLQYLTPLENSQKNNNYIPEFI